MDCESNAPVESGPFNVVVPPSVRFLTPMETSDSDELELAFELDVQEASVSTGIEQESPLADLFKRDQSSPNIGDADSGRNECVTQSPSEEQEMPIATAGDEVLAVSSVLLQPPSEFCDQPDNVVANEENLQTKAEDICDEKPTASENTVECGYWYDWMNPASWFGDKCDTSYCGFCCLLGSPSSSF